MELVDMFDSKSDAAMRVGSSPIPGKLLLLFPLLKYRFLYATTF